MVLLRLQLNNVRPGCSSPAHCAHSMHAPYGTYIMLFIRHSHFVSSSPSYNVACSLQYMAETTETIISPAFHSRHKPACTARWRTKPGRTPETGRRSLSLGRCLHGGAILSQPLRPATHLPLPAPPSHRTPTPRVAYNWSCRHLFDSAGCWSARRNPVRPGYRPLRCRFRGRCR